LLQSDDLDLSGSPVNVKTKVKAKDVIILVVSLGAVAAFYLLYAYADMISCRRAGTLHVKGMLLEAYCEKTNGTAFINRHPERCRVFDYTNYYLIGGTGYQCSVAADSWDYQGASNLLVVTTNWRQFLYINETGVTLVRFAPPGY